MTDKLIDRIKAHRAYLAAAEDTGRTARHTQAHYAAQIIGGLDL